ncbi:MAG: hypothetical protein ABL907_25420 [Hyphomicrobium sp.]
MSASNRADFAKREEIMALLSDGEIAKVSSAETAAGLADGAEYLDLEHLELGVLRASAATKVTMAHALPKAAVRPETWTKVLARVGH